MAGESADDKQTTPEGMGDLLQSAPVEIRPNGTAEPALQDAAKTDLFKDTSGLTGAVAIRSDETAEPASQSTDKLSALEDMGELLRTVPVQIGSSETAEPAPQDISCPRCGHAMRKGELICPSCGFAMSESIETHRIEESEARLPSGPQRAGEAIVDSEKPISFEVNGEVLNFSIHETLIIGRHAGPDAVPDVDLTPFGAEKCGVSRRHAQLKRRGNLIYIVDLNSTNRTFLNGYRLIPGGERLLRDGDELRLGQLKIRVRF
jgi:ribosomal protein L37E